MFFWHIRILVKAIPLYLLFYCCVNWNIVHSEYTLTIQPSLLCLERGKPYIVHCNLRSNDTAINPITNSSLEWYQDGQSIPFNRVISHQTTNTLMSQVTLHSTGEITCLAKNGTLIHGQKRIFADTRPVEVKQIIGKPIYTRVNSKNIVKISWKSDGRSDYVLAYRWQQDASDYPFQPTTWNFVGKSSGFLTCSAPPNDSTCTATFDEDHNIYTNVSFYVITRGENCTAKSATWTVYLVPFYYEDSNNSIIFIPPRAKVLYITTSHRALTLHWSHDDMQLRYYYTYQCNKMPLNQSKTTESYRNRVKLTDKDIEGYQPFNTCVFCVYIQWYAGGEFSQARCNRTRLHEEIPQRGPRITCTVDTCATYDNGRVRNLAITWQLGAEVTWNGVLTKLIVYTVSNVGRHAKQIGLPRKINLTSNGSVGLELNRTDNYVIFMKTCNKAGCSTQGNSIEIPALAIVPDTTQSTSHSLEIVIGIVLAVIFVVVVACLVLYQMLRQRHLTVGDTRPLPELQEPNDMYYAAPLDPKTGDYTIIV